jgi:hypothetical protein
LQKGNYGIKAMAVKTEIRTYTGRYFQAIPLMLAVLWHCGTSAQVATATIDTKSIRIGEQVQMKLKSYRTAIGKGHLASVTPFLLSPRWRSLQPHASTLLRLPGRLTFNTSRYLQLRHSTRDIITIPPVVIEYRMPGDTSRFISMTDSLILHVLDCGC